MADTIPEDLRQAEILVEKLSIDELRTFCSSFGLDDLGSKAELKKKLLQYYWSKFQAKREIRSDDRDQLSRTHMGISMEQRLENSEERIVRVEHSVNEMQLSIQNELSTFRQAMEAVMGRLQQPQFSTPLPERPVSTFERLVSPVREKSQSEQVIAKNISKEDVSVIGKMNRKKKFLTSTVERIMIELDRLIQSKAESKRVERQLTKLNELESEIIKAVDETVTNIDDDDLAEEAIENWEDIRAQVVQAEDQAEMYITKNMTTTTSEFKSVKLPSLDLPKFSGKVLEWPAFNDAFYAAVGSNPKLSNVQKLTHLRGSLTGTALRCIEGYAVINENYEKAMQDLANPFGRKRLVISELVKSILTLKTPDVSDSKALRYLYDTLRNRLRSLESNGLNLKDNRSLVMILLPIFETKLPGDLREKWEFEVAIKCGNDDSKVDIELFFKFLEGHVLSKEARNDFDNTKPPIKPKYKAVFQGRRKENTRSDVEYMSSASALVNTTESWMKCGFCSQQHKTTTCKLALSKPVDERWNMLKKNTSVETCYNCLLPGNVSHNSRTCKKPKCSIDGCGKRHHTLLHTGASKATNSGDIRTKDIESSATISGFVSTKAGHQRLLPTACARLIYNGAESMVRLLLDSGSEETFLNSNVCDVMGMKKEKLSTTTMNINMLGEESQRKKVHRVAFKLAPMNTKGDQDSIDIEAWTVNNVCVPLAEVKFNAQQCSYLKDLELADHFPRKTATVDLLVGIDQYHDLVHGAVKRGPVGCPVAISSKLGWLLSGPVPGHVSKSGQVFNMLTVTRVEDPPSVLKRFWELDAIGLVDNPRNSLYDADEEHAVKQFEENITYDGERYTVGLPWKKNPPVLVDNYQQAEQRLVAIEKALKRNPDKAKSYCDSMSQYITDGHAREIKEEQEEDGVVRYLPHHAVFREDKATTKCRIVFDASSKTSDGVSLNSCLLKGPKLQPDLVHVLIRFRCHRVALMADIKKMFLQILLKRKDQNSHRFLWRDLCMETSPKKYCMTRVTFGNTSSPFLSIGTVQKHAKDKEKDYPNASQEILQNMYVDDLLSGSEDGESSIQLKEEMTSLMKSGGFILTKWASNSNVVMDNIPPEERAPNVLLTPSSNDAENKSDLLKVLGISWNTLKDVFFFQAGSTIVKEKDPLTKRSLISLYARLFDPMGLMSPFLIQPKILFQELWARGRDWDDNLDDDISREWNKWKEELCGLEKIEIPRCLLPLSSKEQKVEVHGFGDASLKAYGAAVYLLVVDEENNRSSNLIMAKSRVAPTKRMTLPRLELLAAYVTARLIDYVTKALRIPVHEVYAWTDSQVALSWIRKPSNNWKVFVANRVQDIQEKVDPEKWHYCPGEENPADKVTRGISVQELMKSELWWHGPLWLTQDVKNWPQNKHFDNLPDQCLSEAKTNKSTIQCNFAVPNNADYLEISQKYEAWLRLVRITAWLLKWSRLRGISKNGQLSATEIKESEFVWLRIIQKKAFGDEYNKLIKGKGVSSNSPILKLDPIFDDQNKVIRVGGRLEFAQIAYETKHQVIIPHHDELVEKIVLHLHNKGCHAGPETTLAILRQRFWLIGGRREVKRIVKKCLVCQHWKTKSRNQKMAPLPIERVQVVPAFTNVGLDFMGPLYLRKKLQSKGKAETTKAYVCIFACEDSRAVQFELTNNMTTEEFLQAFRRMANRRGMPRTIRSDNQTTFHKAARVFNVSQQKLKLTGIDLKAAQDQLANDGVVWKFITERASHRGGHWERVCRQLKEPLRKVLGKALLTYTEMLTTLTDIEAIINSRPLTYIGDDVNDGIIITPALLALNRELGEVPDDLTRPSVISLASRYRYQQKLQQHFWTRWLREYLPRLTVRQKWLQETPPLKMNDTVLVSGDNLPRGKWLLGKVENTFSGKDGLIRTVSVRTKKGIINRPVQRLHLLEEHRDSFSPANNKSPNQDVSTRRNGSSPLVGEDVPVRRSKRLIKAKESTC